MSTSATRATSKSASFRPTLAILAIAAVVILGMSIIAIVAKTSNANAITEKYGTGVVAPNTDYGTLDTANEWDINGVGRVCTYSVDDTLLKCIDADADGAFAEVEQVSK